MQLVRHGWGLDLSLSFSCTGLPSAGVAWSSHQMSSGWLAEPELSTRSVCGPLCVLHPGLYAWVALAGVVSLFSHTITDATQEGKTFVWHQQNNDSIFRAIGVTWGITALPSCRVPSETGLSEVTPEWDIWGWQRKVGCALLWHPPLRALSAPAPCLFPWAGTPPHMPFIPMRPVETPMLECSAPAGSFSLYCKD